MFWSKKKDPISDLAKLLAEPGNKETFLGVKAVRLPSPEDIKKDASQIVRYSESKDYKLFSEEVWSKVLSHLDIILDDKTSHERVQYHRGALKEALDLLRLSYQAREMLKVQDTDQHSVSPAR